ncbi:glycoside hydrolase family 172 protein [Flavitalea sp.]|nr:glycoside hydrolase family 172 protein [Flavitalea sp.]
MKNNFRMPDLKQYFLLIAFIVFCIHTKSQTGTKNLFQFDENSKPRWSSPENLNGVKGAGGKENHGAKGRPARFIEAGQTLVLLDIRDQGIINRIWLTINDRSRNMLRSLKLEMFWDGETKPAVSAPLGDFFGMSMGRMTSFSNALFASPEGRSFNCFIPMPFKTGARIQITNETSQRLSAVFFDVDYQLTKKWNPDNLYFHAYWHRDTATVLARDFELLPKVNGRGRLLGVDVGINANPAYGNIWWGEGEVKLYLDGDKDFPTLVGTGTEDYIGNAWSQAVFVTDYTGCLVADEPNLQWTFYRYHIPDPIYFENDCRMTLPQMGSTFRKDVLAAQKRGAPMIPTSGDDARGNIRHLYKTGIALDDPIVTEEFALFYRTDDLCSTAYFYLDKPSDDLPSLQPLSIRLHNLKQPKK